VETEKNGDREAWREGDGVTVGDGEREIDREIQPC
jgi:hypothetical protein